MNVTKIITGTCGSPVKSGAVVTSLNNEGVGLAFAFAKTFARTGFSLAFALEKRSRLEETASSPGELWFSSGFVAVPGDVSYLSAIEASGFRQQFQLRDLRRIS